MFQGVAAAQDELDDGPIDGELVLTREVEQGFQHVRQFVDGKKIQETRAAFESVERPKYRVQRLGVARVVLQHEHALLDVVQVLARFIDEFAKQITVVTDVCVERHLVIGGPGFGGAGGFVRRRTRRLRGGRRR